jgi:hypothetical protein
MPQTLPRACIVVSNMPQDDVLVFAQNVLAGLTASVAEFPTPPVTLVALSNLIDNYQAALAAAADLGKENVSAKNAARRFLENGLRTDQYYVNQVIQADIAGGMAYEDAATLILGTGYGLNTTPSPAGPLPAPIIETYRSFNRGQLYLRVQANRNAKGYQLEYRVKGDPDDPWTTEAKPNSRITQDGLTSAVLYQARVSYVGANPTRNFSAIIEQVVI